MSCAPPSRRGRSLRTRLTLLYATIFAVALGAAFLLLAALLQRTALRDVDRILESEARQLLDLATRRKARILQSEIDRRVETHGTGRILLVLASPQGEALAQSEPALANAPLHTLPLDPPGQIVRHSLRTSEGEPMRALRMQASSGHNIAIGVTVHGIERGLRATGWILAAAYGASVALATLLAWLLTREAFQRIEKVRLAAEALAEGDLSRRLSGADYGDEVARLSGTFNHMIERIAAAIDNLKVVTAHLAHDYRTPLTRMRAATEIALQSRTEPARDEALTLVLEECDRMDRMSKNLLQVARLDAGADRPELKVVDLQKIAAEAVDLIGPAYADKGVDLSCESVPAGLQAMGDRTLVERVLANLLDNALKFTPAGGRVRLAGGAEPGHVLVTVADNGIGISADDRERIFQRFYRSAPGAEPGCGLGLSFVQAALRALGGTIRVESEPGRGSTFILHLRAAPKTEARMT